jgi:hypothetical protein
MKTLTLVHSSTLVVLLSTGACFDKGDDVADTMLGGETTTSTTDGATSSTTTDATSTTDAETDSSTETGSTTDAETGSSTTQATSGATTGGAVDPVSYAACPDRTSEECPDLDPLCVDSDGPGGFDSEGNSFFVWWTFCTRACETDADCPTDLDGGSAESVCGEVNGQNVCILDCAFGQSCPSGGYQCGYNSACGNHHCDCAGDGCFEASCQTPP